MPGITPDYSQIGDPNAPLLTPDGAPGPGAQPTQPPGQPTEQPGQQAIPTEPAAPATPQEGTPAQPAQEPAGPNDPQLRNVIKDIDIPVIATDKPAEAGTPEGEAPDAAKAWLNNMLLKMGVQSQAELETLLEAGKLAGI